ncbi:aldehyde ferredoxin oxidoreductase N-terminal domain-containing protein [Chloroflexota bacterium]
MSEFGYAGQIATVDLSEGKIDTLLTADYTDGFIGGRGIAAKIYWDSVSPQTKALDLGNYLIFITGPLAGFPRLAGSRWQICGKSPASDTESFSYANGGGSWGAWLKFAGFDGIAVTSKSDKPVYLYLHDGKVEIRDASALWRKTTVETRDALKQEWGGNARVVAIGPAGENLVRFATLLADDDASASGGFGAVMGSKNLKAIVVSGNRKPTAANPEKLKDLSDRAFELRKNTWGIYPFELPGEAKLRACYGCVAGCSRSMYKATTGEQGKFFCQSSVFYMDSTMKYHGTWDEVIFHAGRLCNEYGLNTNIIEPMTKWLSRCHEAGILTDEETGIPISKIGSYEFIESLIRKISFREGFGETLSHGVTTAAELIGKGSKELIGDLIATKAGEDRVYDPRLYNVTALMYATEPRKPIRQLHEVSWPMVFWASWTKKREGSFISSEVLRNIARRFWGSEAAADFTTNEGVALAVKTIQDRTYVEDSLILCDYTWPITWVRHSGDHLGDTSLESQIFSAITGREMDGTELNRIGERIFNLQRVIMARECCGGRETDKLLDFFHAAPLESEPHLNRKLLVMDGEGEPMSRKGAMLKLEDFEKLKDDYYELRGWDTISGMPTEQKLKELGLEEIAP